MSMTRTVVVASNGLHTLADTYNHEYQEVTVGVADAVSSHRVVAAVVQ